MVTLPVVHIIPLLSSVIMKDTSFPFTLEAPHPPKEDILQALHKDSSCPICDERGTPKMLALCGHIVCAECEATMLHYPWECPTCRRPYPQFRRIKLDASDYEHHDTVVLDDEIRQDMRNFIDSINKMLTSACDRNRGKEGSSEQLLESMNTLYEDAVQVCNQRHNIDSLGDWIIQFGLVVKQSQDSLKQSVYEYVLSHLARSDAAETCDYDGEDEDNHNNHRRRRRRERFTPY